MKRLSFRLKRGSLATMLDANALLPLNVELFKQNLACESREQVAKAFENLAWTRLGPRAVRSVQ